jgi:hypothetical protein
MDSFNANGGGMYVTQWTSTYINIWFFPRNNIPQSIQSPSTTPDVCQFGRPDASFTGCNFDKYFANQQLVITNTFCGDWGMYI